MIAASTAHYFGKTSRSIGAVFSSPEGFLLIALAVVLIVSLYLGWRDPLTARIGFRSFVRGRRRTVVLLLGLLVGAAIISSSLVVGDTVGTLTTHFVYVADGNVHEAVFQHAPNVTYAPFPYSFYLDLNHSMSNQSYVAGLSPMVLEPGALSGIDLNSGVPQTGMNLVGTDANVSAALGPFTSTGGRSIPGPFPGEVLLNPTAAQDLDAKVGDHLTLISVAQTNLSVTVQAIVQADGRGGFQDNGEGNVFTTIADAQSLVGNPNQISYIAVTNVGGAQGGIQYTGTVMNELNDTLPGVIAQFPPHEVRNIAAHNILQDDISDAQSSASQLTTLFLVIGLFSIVAGSILVVGIFVLLSEERRGQMGVARAVGMTRRQLIKSYYFEGLAYAAGSAVIGTLLGVGIAFLLVEYLVSSLAPGASSQAILSSFTVLPSSLLTAYVTGFLLTLATMVITVTYVSRLNIVRAIRNLPEPPLNRKSYLKIGLLGGLSVLLGLLLVDYGLPQSVDLSYGALGISLIILGAGLVASALLPNRISLTGMGVAMVAFWGYVPIRQYLFGSGHSSSIFLFFLEGIFLILGAIVIYLVNADLVMRALSRVLYRQPKAVPVVMVAFSYPQHKTFRTAMTLAIFAMVLFTIVAIASIGAGLSSNLDARAAAQSGGFTMFGQSTVPIPDFVGTVQNNSTLNPEISTMVSFYSSIGKFTPVGAPPSQSFDSAIAAAPLGMPAREDFYSANHYNFSATFDGMSPAQVWQTLETNSTAVVLSGDHSSGGIQFGSTRGEVTPGELLNISLVGSRQVDQVHVIGILAEQVISVVLMNPGFMVDTLQVNTTGLFLVSTAGSASAQNTIYGLERTFFTYGLQMVDFEQVFASSLQFLIAFIDLLEIFVALGLIVGIAAIGILALRAVVERRGEIGMIRALGFRRRQVLWAFLTEYSFLALLGIGIGVVLGVLLSYDISVGVSGFFTFSIPWTNILLIVGLCYGLTLLATGGPSFRASRIPPAEALRFAE